jgi:hypothetical protein
MSRGDDPVVGGMVTTGLTIREHFAAMAMWSPRNPHNSMDHEAAADWARIEADALIAELAKERT